MIESTFILLKGIGAVTERRWWQDGLVDWSTFRQAPTVKGLSPARKRWHDDALAQATEALAALDAAHFGRCLRPRDHWRLYPLFRERALFLDIETTGGEPAPGSVTVVGAAAGARVTQLVQGVDLDAERLYDLFADVPMVVTFFGSVFDLPYLKQVFPALPSPPLHLDLCFAARRVGLTGGLKQVETLCGIEREQAVVGLDGWDAVRLWQQWRNGDAQALDRLLRYNRADVVNLITLADNLYGRLVADCGLPAVASATHAALASTASTMMATTNAP